MDFHSLVDSVRLAAIELFYELLFKLFHEKRLARLRYGERGLYFMSATEGDDAAVRDEQWLHDVVVVLRVIVMSPTPKLYLDASAGPDGLLRRSVRMLGEPLGDQGTERLFHKIIFLATVR